MEHPVGASQPVRDEKCEARLDSLRRWLVGLLLLGIVGTGAELQALPHMTLEIAKALIAKRPFTNIVGLNRFLLEREIG